MLIVVASRFDDEACALVEQWDATPARVLVPRDLSRPEWRDYSDGSRRSTVGVGNQVLPLDDIRGVLTLMPAVAEQELDHIAQEDRSYVAAEMHAFLFAWLSKLACPVINRPASGCLNGPAWTTERWTWEAHRAGLDTGSPVSFMDRSIERVTVVGTRVFPDVGSLAAQVCRLARAAEVDILCVTLARGRFVHASARPDLAMDGVANALQARVCGLPA